MTARAGQRRPRSARSEGLERDRGEAGTGRPGSQHDLPVLLDIGALARHLGTSERHIRRLVDEKRIPYLKIGGLVRFDAAEVARWVEGCRVAVFDRASVAHPGWYHERH